MLQRLIKRSAVFQQAVVRGLMWECVCDCSFSWCLYHCGFKLICVSVIKAGTPQIFFMFKKKETYVGFCHLQTKLTSLKISIYSRCHVFWQRQAAAELNYSLPCRWEKNKGSVWITWCRRQAGCLLLVSVFSSDNFNSFCGNITKSIRLTKSVRQTHALREG